MQLDGFLSRFALRELLELSVASLVSGAIEVQTPSGTHRIFFKEGRCVHATSPDANGFDAIWPLFELDDAPFRFVAGCVAYEQTITEPTLQVIDQAEALARQWSTIRPHIPHLEVVPQLVTPSNGEHVRIYEEDWPVLSCVDGSRTIREIARAALLDPLEVCTGLLRLKERGLLTLNRQRAVAEPPAATPAAVESAPAPRATPAPRERASFFAKLLISLPEADLPPVPAASANVIENVPEIPIEQDEILRLLRAS